MTRGDRSLSRLALLLALVVFGATLVSGTMAAPPVRNGGAGERSTPTPPATAGDEASRERFGVRWALDPGERRPANTLIRPRPTAQTFDNPARGEVGTVGRRVAPDRESGGRRRIRLDDPVLRWLPEILAASEATGTPPSLIASVIAVESSGDPRAVSPAGARGLMQIMPAEFHARAVPRSRWHHPATNIYVGALILAERRDLTGSWRGAVGRYFGIGCDAHGTCTSVYVRRVLAEVNDYAAIIRDPQQSGLDVLPADWRPPR